MREPNENQALTDDGLLVTLQNEGYDRAERLERLRQERVSALRMDYYERRLSDVQEQLNNLRLSLLTLRREQGRQP